MASSMQTEIQELREKLARVESMPWAGSPEWRRRQAEGIKAAKERGQHFGRARVEMPEGFKKLANQWARNEITASRAAEELGVSRNTFVRRAREHCCVQKPASDRGH